MDITTAIVTIIFSFIILFKLYSLRKNGIKETLKRKIIVFPIIIGILGIFVLLNPEHTLQNPKDILTDFVSSIVNKKDI